MSDKVKRTVDDVHQDYSKLCAQAGHLQYTISVLSEQQDAHFENVKEINKQLKELNLEAAKLQAEAAKEAVEAAKSSSEDKSQS